jgi:hypothetical protein
MRTVAKFTALGLLVGVSGTAAVLLRSGDWESPGPPLSTGLNSEVPPARTSPAGVTTPEDVIERFRLTDGGPLLLVTVRFAGKSLPFALDTGSSNGVFDSSLAPHLGDPIGTRDLRTTDGKTRVPVYRSPDAELGGLSLQTGEPVAAADLRSMREGLGVEVYGLIGMDFLGRHVFRVDPDRGEVVFLRSPGPDPGRRVAVTLESKVPHVRVQLSGLPDPQLFLADTGHAAGGGTGLMRADTFDALLAQGRVRRIDTALGASLSGQSLRRRGRVAEAELQGFRHADLIFSRSGWNVLGLNYWSRYVATFDFPGQAIYLREGSRFGQPDTHDLSGLSVVRVGGRTTVVAVDDGTPAAGAGILPGDVILKVNGTNAGDMTLTAIRRLLAVRGAKVTLVLSRGGKEQETAVALPE